jgi:hypothetical protein
MSFNKLGLILSQLFLMPDFGIANKALQTLYLSECSLGDPKTLESLKDLP